MIHSRHEAANLEYKYVKVTSKPESVEWESGDNRKLNLSIYFDQFIYPQDGSYLIVEDKAFNQPAMAVIRKIESQKKYVPPPQQTFETVSSYSYKKDFHPKQAPTNFNVSPIKNKSERDHNSNQRASTSHDFTRGPFEIASQSNPSYVDPPFQVENLSNMIKHHK